MRKSGHGHERGDAEAEGLISIGPDTSPGYEKYVGQSLGSILAGIPRNSRPPMADWRLGRAWAIRGLRSEEELKAFLFDLGTDPDVFLGGFHHLGYGVTSRGSGVHSLQPVGDALRVLLVISIGIICPKSLPKCLPYNVDAQGYYRWRERARLVIPEFRACEKASRAAGRVVLGTYIVEPVHKDAWAALAEIINDIAGHETPN